MMQALVYDGTWEGFLTTVFCVYEHKLTEVKIYRHTAPETLFDTSITITTDADKARRVQRGLSKKMSADGLHSLYCSYLADTLTEEDNMMAYIRHALSSNYSIEKDYSYFAVMRMQRVEKMMRRESHRMKAFIRFKLTTDQIYYAAVEPDFDVIPLFRSHFEKRYADQQWLIYDLRRDYGIFYDQHAVQIVHLSFNENENGSGNVLHMDEGEELFQTLWQQYFKSTNIATRKNMKLHIQHMPRRYWKLLTEKHIYGKDII